MPHNLANTPNQPINHRQKLIGIDTASTPDKSVISCLHQARVFNEKSREILDKDNDVGIQRAVCSIVTYAMASADVLHISVDYCPISPSFSVFVSQRDCNYQDTTRKFDFSTTIFLYNEDALQELKAVEDELIELVGLAKDRFMGAV